MIYQTCPLMIKTLLLVYEIYIKIDFDKIDGMENCK